MDRVRGSESCLTSAARMVQSIERKPFRATRGSERKNAPSRRRRPPIHLPPCPPPPVPDPSPAVPPDGPNPRLQSWPRAQGREAGRWLPRGRHFPSMLVEILKAVLSALRSVFQSRAALLAANVVLRQQLIVLHRSVPKPRLRAEIGLCSRSLPTSSARCSRRSSSCGLKPSPRSMST